MDWAGAVRTSSVAVVAEYAVSGGIIVNAEPSVEYSAARAHFTVAFACLFLG